MKAPIKSNKITINLEEFKKLAEIKIIAIDLINVINSTNQVLNLEVNAKLNELIEKL